MRLRLIRFSRAPELGRTAISGHMLVELLVVLTLLSLLLGLAYEALGATFRFYRHQAQRAESREAARLAVEVLAAELRAAGPTDLYALGPDSLALRSTIGVGVVCEVRDDRLILWRTGGVFAAEATDSILLFVERDPAESADDTVATARILAVLAGPSDGCPGGAPAERSVAVEPPIPHGVQVGAPLRAFRPYVYRVYRGGDGRWWLGQRLRGGTIQPIAGPLAPPQQGGLRLHSLDAMGRPYSGVGQISGVRIQARSQVRRRTRHGPKFLSDSARVRVTLRNR